MQKVEQSPQPLSYRIKDAASVIGVSRRTVERWIADGTLRTKRVRRTVFIPAGDVIALVAAEA